MGITIDLSPIQEFFNLPPDQVMRIVLVDYGWIPIAVTIVWGALQLWLFWRQNLYGATLSYVWLAVDIPRGNEQSVKAVENMFTYFGGAHSSPSLIEKWWHGIFQLGFSFDIVSIDGYTQFLIGAPVQFRNLVESAVYSQYPDAEIIEVGDYAEAMPSRFPDNEWDIWGAEFILSKSDAFPIKLYREFGDDQGRPETQFKDPMASLMDMCSTLRKGEQLWYQILVWPTDFSWTKVNDKEVGKILKEGGSNGDIFDSIIGMINNLVDWIFSLFGGEPPAASETKEEPLKMLQLKPKEKKQVEAIQEKGSKLGFYVKSRMIYAAKKEIINKPKVVAGFVGYLKQFTDLDLNGIKPEMIRSATSTEYFFKDYRLRKKKNKIMHAYKARSGAIGSNLQLFTVDELATIWHFPIEATVRAPLIQKAPGRKAEPPMTLPISEDGGFSKIFIPGQESVADLLAAGELSRKAKAAPGGKSAGEKGFKEKTLISVKEELPAKEEPGGFGELPWGEIAAKEKTAAGSKAPQVIDKRGSPPENLPFV